MKSNNNIGCVAFLFAISIGFLVYLFFKSDPKTEMINKKNTEWRNAFLAKFSYNPDSVGNVVGTQYLSRNLSSNAIVKKRCLVVDENDDLKMEYSIMGGLEDSLIAFKIKELNTIIIYKYINGESHFEQGYEVSTDVVELTYIEANSLNIIKMDRVLGSGGYSISNGRRSNTKHSDVYIKDVISSIQNTINNLN